MHFLKNISFADIIGDFLWLLASGLQKWVNTLICGHFLLHPDSIPAKSILLFQKSMFFFHSWWHRFAFLSVLSYALRFEDPRVSLPFFSNVHSWDKLMFWVQSLFHIVIAGEFLKVYNKIQSQGPAAGHIYLVYLSLWYLDLALSKRAWGSMRSMIWGWWVVRRVSILVVPLVSSRALH